MRFFSGRGQRGFCSKHDIIAQISESNNFDPAECLESADGFIIFQSGLIKSWLVSTRLRLYNIIDDIGKKDARINWSISRSKISISGELSLDIVVRGGKQPCEGSSLIDIGYRQGNPFSPELFDESDVAEKILALVAKKMG